MRSPRLVFLLAILAIAVYAPFLEFPFVGSSFVEIPVSGLLATLPAFHILLQNANWHFRITYAALNSVLAQWGGFYPRYFYLSSVTIHASCAVAIYFLGRWKVLPSRAALWAAGFFAVYQGHHGAIVLLSSWPDLLTGLFACLSLACWVGWLERESKLSYALSLLFCVAAIGSSEAGIATVLLLLVTLAAAGNFNKARLVAFLPFAALAVAAFVAQFVARPNSVAWSDSVPPLDAWWITIAWSVVAALAVTLYSRTPEMRRVALYFSAWIIAVFLIDLFDRRVLHVSGNSVYLASIGMAILVGSAFAVLIERVRVPIAAALALVIIAGNVALLWSVSRRQLLGYAAPTSALVNAALYATAPIELNCFPFPVEIAEAAAGWVGGRIAPITDRKAVRKPHCVSFRYRDANGSVRQVFQHASF